MEICSMFRKVGVELIVCLCVSCSVWRDVFNRNQIKSSILDTVGTVGAMSQCRLKGKCYI